MHVATVAKEGVGEMPGDEMEGQWPPLLQLCCTHFERFLKLAVFNAAVY